MRSYAIGNWLFILLRYSYVTKAENLSRRSDRMILASTKITPDKTAGLEITEGRYTVRLARSRREIESALRLRFTVFKRELSNEAVRPDTGRLEFDAYDFRCGHLIVVENGTGRTVGTYRLNTIETALSVRGFYSYGEFRIEDLPAGIIEDAVEIGRVCVAREHRNSKVLFLLWKGLAAYSKLCGKRYFFGCCSIFSNDIRAGAAAYRQIRAGGHLHDSITLTPKANAIHCDLDDTDRPASAELPNLFQMYLRMGAKVCGPPMIDREFGTIDFFVVLDTRNMNDRYRAMFFG